ncbi:MAG TPA: methyltransferase domain-containing protein, partial [Nevskiaceae bacterium]|nr:methyltransferase domain-containing protein [Nevskiaceae bacterium]
MSAFKDLEHAGWTTAVGDYDAAFARLTSQSVPAMLDAVKAGPGVRLLDVACGPGYVAGEAARRGARVVGIDFSSTMVALARARFPEIDFREGDAEALDLPDAAFDAVTMNFGLLHLDRPQAALAQAARVLVRGGRFAFTVWAPPEETAAFRIALGAVARCGNPNVALPPGPPFFQFADAAVASQALERAGFTSPRVERVPQVW